MTELPEPLGYYLAASLTISRQSLKYYAQGAFDAASSPTRLHCGSAFGQQSSDWMPIQELVAISSFRHHASTVLIHDTQGTFMLQRYEAA